MPRLNSFAEVFADVEGLLAAVLANADQLPDLDNAKAPLEKTFADMRDMSARRATLNADKQVHTQSLQELVQRARDQSSELRGFVRSKIGMRSEKLVEFRVRPKRLGVRKAKGSTPTPATPPPTEPPKTPPPTGAQAPAPAGAQTPAAAGPEPTTKPEA